jgi:hypothetical protein
MGVFNWLFGKKRHEKKSLRNQRVVARPGTRSELFNHTHDIPAPPDCGVDFDGSPFDCDGGSDSGGCGSRGND